MKLVTRPSIITTQWRVNLYYLPYKLQLATEERQVYKFPRPRIMHPIRPFHKLKQLCISYHHQATLVPTHLSPLPSRQNVPPLHEHKFFSTIFSDSIEIVLYSHFSSFQYNLSCICFHNILNPIRKLLDFFNEILDALHILSYHRPLGNTAFAWALLAHL